MFFDASSFARNPFPPTLRENRRATPTAHSLLMVTTSEAPRSFEAALAELEEIVATMEGGQLPLAESLAAYKRGALLLQYCQSALKDAQLQVEVLEKGILKAFEPTGVDTTTADDES